MNVNVFILGADLVEMKAVQEKLGQLLANLVQKGFMAHFARYFIVVPRIISFVQLNFFVYVSTTYRVTIVFYGLVPLLVLHPGDQ